MSTPKPVNPKSDLVCQLLSMDIEEVTEKKNITISIERGEKELLFEFNEPNLIIETKEFKTFEDKILYTIKECETTKVFKELEIQNKYDAINAEDAVKKIFSPNERLLIYDNLVKMGRAKLKKA